MKPPVKCCSCWLHDSVDVDDDDGARENGAVELIDYFSYVIRKLLLSIDGFVRFEQITKETFFMPIKSNFSQRQNQSNKKRDSRNGLSLNCPSIKYVIKKFINFLRHSTWNLTWPGTKLTQRKKNEGTPRSCRYTHESSTSLLTRSQTVLLLL